MDQVHANQSKEVIVIEFTNTVIQPFAVMVEDCNTSIAITTVLSSVMHMRIANLTHEVEVHVNNLFPIIVKRKIYPSALRLLSK
jgi:hypothetical protein